MSALQELFFDESGSALVEYGIVTATLAVTCIGAFFVLVNVINAEFQTTSNALLTFETGTPP